MHAFKDPGVSELVAGKCAARSRDDVADVVDAVQVSDGHSRDVVARHVRDF